MKTSCVRAFSKGVAQRDTVHNTANITFENQRAVIIITASPAIFTLIRNRVEALYNGCDNRRAFFNHKTASNRNLRNGGIWRAVFKTVDKALDLKRFICHAFEVFTRNFRPAIQCQAGLLATRVNQIIIKLRLVFDILRALAALDFIERGLGDIEIATLNKLWHLAVKESQQKRTDMRAVNIRIGHDDDFMITDFINIKIFSANTCA